MGNFAYTYLSGTHTSASTTFTVTTGEGTRFTANKYVTVWNSTDYPNAAAAFWASPKQAEVVLIGTPAANSTTVTRAQLGTTAISFTTGKVYQLFEGVFDALVLPVTRTNGHFLKSDGTNWAGSALAASDIASGTIATARLGSGSAGATNYLRGDQSWQTLSIPNYVDVPISIVTAGNFAAQSTTYQPFGSGISNSTDGSAGAGVVGAYGIVGTVVGMYVGTRSNTLNDFTGTPEMRLWVNNATTAVVCSYPSALTFSEDITHTQALIKTDKIQIRWVSSSGGGAIVAPSITIVVRVPLVTV